MPQNPEERKTKEQREQINSSNIKKTDKLNPEETAATYLKKGNWLLDKFEQKNPETEKTKKKIEEKQKAHFETAEQLADYYKHSERQNSQTYSRLLEEYSLSLVELVNSLEGAVGAREKIKTKIIVFGTQQPEKPIFDASMITGEPPRYQKQKEVGLVPQQQEITAPETIEKYQDLKQKMADGLLLTRYNIYLETGDKKYKRYFDEYWKNAPQDENSKRLEHIQQLRVTDPIEAYRQCAKLAKDFPQAKELAADILTRNSILTEFNNELVALMHETQPFRQSIDSLIGEIQKNGAPSQELLEKWVYPAAQEAKNTPRIAKIMNSPAYQLFLNLKEQYGGKQNEPSIEVMIGDVDASFKSLGPDVEMAFSRMQENILQGFNYCQEVKKTAEIALNIKGEGAGIKGFTVDALVAAGKTLLAVAGAVTAVACFPATGAVAATILGGFGAAFGSAVGEATFENDYSGFMPKNFAMNWVQGAVFSGAGRIAGAALGSVGGKTAAAIAKGNDSWSRSAQEYAEKYIQRMAQRAGSGEAEGFKHLIAEIASETREEFMEDALQRIGQGIAPDHPWLGFAFSLIPSATTAGKSTFAKAGIKGNITNSGVELKYDANNPAAARTFLEQRGAPPTALQQFDEIGRVDLTQEGVRIKIEPAQQSPDGYKAAYEEDGRNLVLFNALRAEIEAGKISPDALRALNKIFYPGENDWKLPEGLDPKQANELLAQKIAEVSGLSLPRARQLIPSVMGGIGNNAEWWARLFKRKEAAQMYAHLDMSLDEKEVLHELYPEGIARSDFKQQNVGDCYFLVSLHSLKNHPLAPYLISRMITKNGNNWEVRFLGTNEVITVTESETNGQKAWDPTEQQWIYKKSVEGNLGDRILERAFGKMRKKNRMEKDSPTMYVIEGGFEHEALDVMLGRYLGKIETYLPRSAPNDAGKFENTLLKAAKNPNKYFLFANTSGAAQPPLLESHAYAIAAINVEQRTITVVDPHDTKSKRFNFTFEEAFQRFHNFESIPLKTDNLRKDFRDFAVTDEIDEIREGPLTKILTPKDIYHYSISPTQIFKIQAGLRPSNTINCWTENGRLIIQTPKITYTLIPGQTVQLGRETISDDRSVSNKHVEIAFGGDGKIWIQDLGSTNGTIVNKTNKPREDNRGMDLNVERPILGGRLNKNSIYEYRNYNSMLLLMGPADTTSMVRIEKTNSGKIKIWCQNYEWTLSPGQSMTMGAYMEELKLSSAVSGKHLNIQAGDNGAVYLQDLSTNGTFVLNVN